MSTTAPASAPQALSVDGCSLTWTYPDPTDADGYIVTIGLQEGVETTDTDYTVVLSDSVGPGTSWPVTVRAYQEILGPAAQTNISKWWTLKQCALLYDAQWYVLVPVVTGVRSVPHAESVPAELAGRELIVVKVCIILLYIIYLIENGLL